MGSGLRPCRRGFGPASPGPTKHSEPLREAAECLPAREHPAATRSASGIKCSLAWSHSRTLLQLDLKKPAKLALFEQIILPHLPAAYNLARWMTRNDHDAEDAVQEAYLRAFRFFEGFQGGDGKAWLLAVVRNTCLTWRTRQRQDAVEFDEQRHAGSTEMPDAEKRLVKESQLGSLRECIEGLPPEYREVIVMREMEEMQYREISDTANIPIGTVMSRLSRARKRLEDCVRLRMKGYAG